MSENVSPILSLLRLVAFLGIAVVLLWHVVSIPELQPRQSAGFIILGLALLAVGLILLILSDTTKRIPHYTDLLVPLGPVVTANCAFLCVVLWPKLLRRVPGEGGTTYLAGAPRTKKC